MVEKLLSLLPLSVMGGGGVGGFVGIKKYSVKPVFLCL